MTYQDRKRYQELRSRVEELRGTLEARPAEEPLTRGEALEILALLEAAIERVSPERWDRALEAVATEAARRAGSPGGY